MMIQSLEQRRLLSVTDYLSGGTLFIEVNDCDFSTSMELSSVEAAEKGEVVVLRYVEGKLKVVVNTFLQHRYDEADITSICAKLGGANDVFRVLGEQCDGDVEPVTVYAGSGDDTIEIAADNNACIFGENGMDIIITSAGADWVFGGNGEDIIRTYGGCDFISGGNGDDLLYGGAGEDILNGDHGSDVLYGNGGNDLLCGGKGSDRGFGGGGAADASDGTVEQFFQTL